jgi:hypothetical protein
MQIQIPNEEIEKMLKPRKSVAVMSIVRDLGVGYATAGKIIDILQQAGRVGKAYDTALGGFPVLGIEEEAQSIMFIIATPQEVKKIPDDVLGSADVVLIVQTDVLKVEKNRYGSVGGAISWQSVPSFLATIKKYKKRLKG